MQPATCPSASLSTGNGGGGGEIMLFGVRVVVDSMRKSVSMNNLFQYEHIHESNTEGNKNNKDQGDDKLNAGYVSADDAVRHTTGNRERKRGVPWTEEEHKLFLAGLQKVGKGDWRRISRNFVKTRTPTQIASHAQKYFLRRSNLNRRRRRSSLFDITTDTVQSIPMEEDRVDIPENTTQPCETNVFPMIPASFPMAFIPLVPPFPVENLIENLTITQENQSNNNVATANLISRASNFSARQISDLNTNSVPVSQPLSLSLELSLRSDQMDSSSSASRHSPFQAMPDFSNGDKHSMVSVA